MKMAKNRLKAKMLSVFRSIEKSGEELIVTDRNRPVLRVIPYKKKNSPDELFKSCRGKVRYNGDINAPTADEWTEK